jgi:hypothetical protein
MHCMYLLTFVVDQDVSVENSRHEACWSLEEKAQVVLALGLYTRTNTS